MFIVLKFVIPSVCVGILDYVYSFRASCTVLVGIARFGCGFPREHGVYLEHVLFGLSEWRGFPLCFGMCGRVSLCHLAEASSSLWSSS